MRDNSRLCVMAALVAAGLLMCANGCDDDSLPTMPPATTGLVRGWIHDGGDEPLAVGLRFEDVLDDGYDFSVSAETDPLGRFAVTVPRGDVVLRFALPRHGSCFYGHGGLRATRAEAETLRVGTAPLDLDVVAGRLAVDVAFPSEVDGEPMSLEALLDDRNVAEALATTAETTRFELRMLPVGSYVLGVKRWGGSPTAEFYLPGTYDPEEAERIAVPPLAPTVAAFAVPAPCRLAGVVTGSWQQMGGDRPRVDVIHGSGRRVAGEAVDRDGGFAYDLPVPGEYRLRIAIGNIDAWYGGGTVFDLGPGEAVTDLLHVESGILCNLSCPEPPRSWEHYIRVYDETGDEVAGSAVWGYTTRTAISNLAPGSYTLQVSPLDHGERWMPQYWDRADSAAAATPVDVAPGGAVTEIDVRLEIGGEIRGRVTDGEGAPLPWEDLRIRVFAADGGEGTVAQLVEQDYDPATGDYVVRGLPNGEYRIVAIREWFWVWYPGTPYPEQAGTVIVAGHGAATGIDWPVEFMKRQ